MTGHTNDGGSAFPVVFPERDDALLHGAGMTLRDYFAAQALAGQIAYEGAEGCGNDGGSADVAAWCYELADAMLLARNQGHQ